MAVKKDCWSIDEEHFKWDSLEELLQDNSEYKAGDMAYVGDSVHPTWSQFCDAEDVLDMMATRASDIGGDYAEDFPDVTEEAEQELNALLVAWMEKHCKVNFWQVGNVQPYVITEADIDAAKISGNQT